MGDRRLTAGSDPAPIGGSDGLRFFRPMGVLTQSEEHTDADSLPIAPGTHDEMVRRREDQAHHELGMALHAL